MSSVSSSSVLIKGGVWKNTEDEILKAAVMKYGKNQWARIASLLTRKTPKQCKARWYEWLDPQVKKTEWARHEDEKLLHLARLMPTQWRTIAPLVGRTPAQSLARYQQLLDNSADSSTDLMGPSGDDVRRLRPGEIDPDPESKPARPDAVDMDEDEKEMLSEARARLANTMGKKAKRKAREKQIQESRRLAVLQKRRELKAAGIDMAILVTNRAEKNPGMNYNIDIPFHHEQPAGFYNVNLEDQREKLEKKDMVNSLLQDLEGKRRIDIEEEERKKDYKKQKQQKQDGTQVPSQLAPAPLVSARKPLVLPAPWISENEIQELVKMGASGQAAREMVAANNYTPSLVGDYSVATPTPLRTPLATSLTTGDTLKQQALNLKLMNQAQTPLLGGQMDARLDFTPQVDSRVPQTPNALLAQLANTNSPSASVTSITASVRGLRDNMGINTPRSRGFDETPVEFKKRDPRQMFASLPAPKNDFEIVLPQMEQMNDEEHGTGISDDAEDVLKRNEDKKERERELLFKKQTQVVQLELPRPNLPHSVFESEFKKHPKTVQDMITNEKLLLMRNDVSRNLEANDEFKLDVLSDALLALSADLIQKEASKTARPTPLIPTEFDPLPKNEQMSGQIYYTDHMDPQVKVTIYQSVLKANHQELKQAAAVSSKIEKKIMVLHGAHHAKSIATQQAYTVACQTLETAQIDLQVFKSMAEKEGKSENDEGIAERRIAASQKWLETLSMLEQTLQDRYRELTYLTTQDHTSTTSKVKRAT